MKNNKISDTGKIKKAGREETKSKEGRERDKIYIRLNAKPCTEIQFYFQCYSRHHILFYRVLSATTLISNFIPAHVNEII